MRGAECWTTAFSMVSAVCLLICTLQATGAPGGAREQLVRAVVVPRCSGSRNQCPGTGLSSSSSSSRMPAEDNAGSVEIVRRHNDVIMSYPGDDNGRNYLPAGDISARVLRNYIGAADGEEVNAVPASSRAGDMGEYDGTSAEGEMNQMSDLADDLLAPKQSTTAHTPTETRDPNPTLIEFGSEETAEHSDSTKAVSEPYPTAAAAHHSPRDASQAKPMPQGEGNSSPESKEKTNDGSMEMGQRVEIMPPRSHRADKDEPVNGGGNMMTVQPASETGDRLKKGPRIVIMVDVFEDSDGNHIIKPVQDEGLIAEPVQHAEDSTVRPLVNTTSATPDPPPMTPPSPLSVSTEEVNRGMKAEPTDRTQQANKFIVERLKPKTPSLPKSRPGSDESSEDLRIFQRKTKKPQHQREMTTKSPHTTNEEKNNNNDGQRRRYYIQVDPSGPAPSSDDTVVDEYLPKSESTTMSPLEEALYSKADSIKKRIAKVGNVRKSSRNKL